MDNFDGNHLKPQRVNAPEGMYGQVRQRIIHERIRAAKTRQQLTTGAALLLIIGVVNVALILFVNKEKPRGQQVTTEQMLYNTYFDNEMTLANEK